jgi:hypothetical protein
MMEQYDSANFEASAEHNEQGPGVWATKRK